MVRCMMWFQGCALVAILALSARIDAASLDRPPLPPGSPHSPPSYMVDPKSRYADPPDRGTRWGPVLVDQGNRTATPTLLNSNVTSSLDARQGSGYWLENIRHGSMPLSLNANSYTFFRNVKDYGATGDGTTDDTAAINRAIIDQGRCGNLTCGSTTTLGALVYFPAGTYRISSPLIQYYYTQFVGDAANKPTIKGLPTFSGIALIDTDVYIPGGNGSEWYINQNQFYRQVRNFVLDTTDMPRQNQQGDQTYVPCGIHWQVAQSTSLQNIDFVMSVSDAQGAATGVGVFAAISMIWDWGWVWKNIYVLSCYVAIDATMYGGEDGQGTGSIAVLDSTFDGVPYGITVNQQGFLPAIVLDNVQILNSNVAVQYSGGNIVKQVTSGETIQSWAMGRRYTTFDDKGSTVQGDVLPAPSKPAILLDSNGRVFERSKPQYENLGVDSFVNVLDHGVSNDGTGDQSSALNNVLSSSVGSVVFFPAGIYQVQSTVNVPTGTRMVGEGWSQIMGYGSFFGDVNNPKPVVKVGNAGDSGVLEISDMLFTVKGGTIGAILMEWNVKESTQGSAGIWDAHFRVGGAYGTGLDLESCPKFTINNNCMAAHTVFHMTTQSSGYFENVWYWVADHGSADNTASTQISIYSARGVLVESQGPTWFVGTASEHSVFYQYEFYQASNVWMGHAQTETPYFQPDPPAVVPFSNLLDSDPTFSTCPTGTSCQDAWALRVINSTNILLYGGGFYSFFNDYDLACNSLEHCQQKIIDIGYSQGLWFFNIWTKGSVEVVSPQGGLDPVEQAPNQNGFTTEVNVYIPWAEDGANIGGDVSSDDHSTPTCVTIVPLPCTTVAPSATFTVSQECMSGIMALPTTGPEASSQNSPPGPDDCHEVCDFFRLITGTCCGKGGSLCSEVVFPAGVAIPMDIPLTSGFPIQNPIKIPDPGSYDPDIVFGNGDDPDDNNDNSNSDCDNNHSDSCMEYSSCTSTTTYDIGDLLMDIILPGGSCYPFPLIFPVPIPFFSDPPCFSPPCLPCVVGICPIPPPGDDDHEGPCDVNDDECGCDLSPQTGRCANGNFPMLNPDTMTIECDIPDDEVPNFISACQEEADGDEFDQVLDGIACETDPEYCSATSAKRNDITDSLGLTIPLSPRVKAAKQPGCRTKPPEFDDPDQSEMNLGCEYVFVCDTDIWPNVCNNVRSATEKRGKLQFMTYYGKRDDYGRDITDDWYKVHPKNMAPVKQNHNIVTSLDAGTKVGQPYTGWGLFGCEVEEYPWGSSLPPGGYIKKTPIPWNDRSVLRLIPQPENSSHGSKLGTFATYVKDQREADGKSTDEWVFCVRVTGSNQPSDYGLDKDQVNNICGQAYGPAFTLVNSLSKLEYNAIQNDANLRATETQFWDPWFDENNQLFEHTIYSKGNVIKTSSIPSQYGRGIGWTNTPNGVAWGKAAPVGAAGANGVNLKNDQAVYPNGAAPGIWRRSVNDTVDGEKKATEWELEVMNATTTSGNGTLGALDLERLIPTARLHRRALSPRQAAGGSFLDPRVYTEVMLCEKPEYPRCMTEDCDEDPIEYTADDGSDAPGGDGSSDGGGGDSGGDGDGDGDSGSTTPLDPIFWTNVDGTIDCGSSDQGGADDMASCLFPFGSVIVQDQVLSATSTITTQNPSTNCIRSGQTVQDGVILNNWCVVYQNSACAFVISDKYPTFGDFLGYSSITGQVFRDFSIAGGNQCAGTDKTAIAAGPDVRSGWPSQSLCLVNPDHPEICGCP